MRSSYSSRNKNNSGNCSDNTENNKNGPTQVLAHPCINQSYRVTFLLTHKFLGIIYGILSPVHPCLQTADRGLIDDSLPILLQILCDHLLVQWHPLLMSLCKTRLCFSRCNAPCRSVRHVYMQFHALLTAAQNSNVYSSPHAVRIAHKGISCCKHWKCGGLGPTTSVVMVVNM
jgi:hypothetical protein